MLLINMIWLIKKKSSDEEFNNVVWPKLKLEVQEVMKSGIYPSLDVRTNWSLSQLDYFYKNCSNIVIIPYAEDDDVESDNGGIANLMKPEKVDVCSPVTENERTNLKAIINES